MNEANLIKNKKRIEKFGKKFFEIFRLPLSSFTDYMFTFDVMKFDRQVIKSKERNDSPDNLVKKDFGIAGQRLIREILEMPKVKKEITKKKINKEKA